MTSRFGKTYSRKGGEANSKFDEVFSNKKATLSTKWGETTYKAQLGSKRPALKSEVVELPKRPRVEDDDSSEDPFGFDSDEESKPVTSHGGPQTKTEVAEAPKAVPGQGSSGGNTASAHGSRDSNATSTFKPTTGEGVAKNSQSWYRNTQDGNQRPPIAQSTLSKTVSMEMSEDWDSAGRQIPSSSPSMDPSAPGPSVDAQDRLSSERGMGADQTPPAEPVETIAPSPFLLRPSNCKKYQRPNRSNKAPDTEASEGQPPGSGSTTLKPNSMSSAGGSTSAVGNASAVAAAKPAGRGRGRVRDFTVLHPSCLSVCNVTIQDSMERSMDELSTTAPPADLGEAGQMKKKTDAPPPKPTRFRPTQSKTKKETKLEFFGFEDKEGQEGEEGVDSGTGGSSSYKIKYFGFDDLSESDSDEDEESSQAAEKRKAKKAAAAAAAAATSASVNSPPLSDSQDSQSSSNADVLEFSDDSSPGGSEGQKGCPGKQGDKSKDLGRKIFSGPKKVGKSPAKAVYNARHWNQPESEEMPPPPALSRAHTAPASLSSSSKDPNTKSHKDDGLFKAPPPPPKVIKSVTIPTQPYQDIVTALKCRKEHKELYTVVQHVKHFNDVVEFGENQEFTDDFEYLETGLKSSQPLNTRCLSIISLATRCAMPSFRMHLRARGKVAQVFKMLSDSPQHPNLALCTASLMYILSRDRLNMDLDRASLELMLRLLEQEQEQDLAAHQDQLTPKEVAKVKEKIRKLCETVHNKHLDLENITSGHLAMETLLSLTSKRAGDWFKEELRLLGGLDHIVDKVKECVQNLSQEEDKENLVASLWGAERCLRVLESVTVQNLENQSYLIAYKDSQLIISSTRGLQYCEEMIQRYSREVNVSLSSSGTALPHCSFSNVGKAVEDCMRAVIGVLLNLTHDNEWGSTKTGEQDQLIPTALNCVLRVPRYLPQEQRFDIRVLGLGLLINLVEYSARNRHCLVDMDFTAPSFPEDSLPQAQEEREQAPASQAPASQAPASQPPASQPGAAPSEPTAPGPEEQVKPPGSGALAALVQFFLERERAAIQAEAQTDDLISEAPKPQHDQSGQWQETSGEIQWVAAENNDSENDKEKEKKEEEEEELDLNKALQHAGKHMEDSIVASYTALLLGCLCQGSQVNVTTVRETLPKGDFSIMTEMLKKFLNFMNLTCAMGSTGQKSISRVIDYLEHC
ncbi:wings apart-like protein homolog [Osmerus mordax]|uniref:wings apart-like protein homolog n=1 Tax=Osmerus mordax TaxID=8014 RepID=UPI00350EE1F7